MQDAIRPNHQAFKAIYERGYCTWFSLYEKTTESDPPWQECIRLENAFPNHPIFPGNLAVEASFSNTALVKGISTWGNVHKSCDLQSFDEEFFMPVASDRTTTIVISDAQKAEYAFSPYGEEDCNYVTMLILAWTYILSARWAEIIPGASGPEYSAHEAEWNDESILSTNTSSENNTATIDLGYADDNACRWWAAVLAVAGGWDASILNETGRILHSPWSTTLVSEQPFTLSRNSKTRPVTAEYTPASYVTALGYLSSFCEFHKITKQSNIALAAVLLLPAARYDNKTIHLPMPQLRRDSKLSVIPDPMVPMWSKNSDQLDRLLTLSCNAVGTKALLSSIFFEPGIESNVCGAWLQGTFAFLNSDICKDQHTLLCILVKRDPTLGYLWLGAFILGVQTRALQEARQAWWKIDLNVAAWTGTHMSFIQEPVAILPSDASCISRADECRLLYLSHDQHYTVPPLLPFAPFGSTAITDINIDVREHIHCKANHGLKYETLEWFCRDGRSPATTFPQIPLRSKNGQSTNKNISIPYDNLDSEEDDCSEMVTRNIFTWLRDEDGFPVAERAIREHEWIDNLDSDDDSPITGDAQSAVGGNLHGWLLRTMTARSLSI